LELTCGPQAARQVEQLVKRVSVLQKSACVTAIAVLHYHHCSTKRSNQPESSMSKQATLNGKTIDFDAAVNLMDDEIREDLHNKMAPCSDQEFLDAYVAAHAAKYNGEEFQVA
jgi:hypothetical protein